MSSGMVVILITGIEKDGHLLNSIYFSKIVLKFNSIMTSLLTTLIVWLSKKGSGATLRSCAPFILIRARDPLF